MNKAFWKFPWERTWPETWNGCFGDIWKDSSLYEWCLIIFSEINLNGNMACKMHSSNNGVQKYETTQPQRPARRLKHQTLPEGPPGGRCLALLPRELSGFRQECSKEGLAHLWIHGMQVEQQFLVFNFHYGDWSKGCMIKLDHNLFFFSLGNILSQSRVILCMCFRHVLPWSFHFVLQLSLIGEQVLIPVLGIWCLGQSEERVPRLRIESCPEAIIAHLASQGPCTSQSFEFMVILWRSNKSSFMARRHVCGNFVNTWKYHPLPLFKSIIFKEIFSP